VREWDSGRESGYFSINLTFRVMEEKGREELFFFFVIK